MNFIYGRLSWNAANLNPSVRSATLACFVATMSYLGALLAATVMIRQHMDWPFWPGNILVVSVLLLQPRRRWPTIVISALLAFVLFNLHLGLSIRSIIFYQLSDVAEILTATLGLSYVFEGVPQLKSVRALAKYSLFAVLLAPFAGAFFSAFNTHGGYWGSWRMAFLSQALGYLALLPAVLGWVSMRSEWAHAPLSRYLEASVLLVGLLVPGYFSFVSSSTIVEPVLLVIPFLLWAALRFGTTSVGSLTIVIAFLAIWGGVHGSGRFVGSDSVHNVPSIQVFLLFLAAPFMVLAVVVEERKQSQLSLKESEERLRLAAQAGRMFAYDWDVSNDVIERSPEAAQILGIDEAAQSTGQRILAKVHPEDRERITAAIAALTPDKPELRITFRMVRSDGTIIWVERSSRAQFDKQAKLQRLVGMVVDVTERKRAEEALTSLSGRLIQAHEEERSRIARDIHDDYQQRVALFAKGLEAVAKDVENSPGKALARLRELGGNVDELTTDLHTLSHTLHSSMLEILGLVAAIKDFCREFADHQGIQIDFAHQSVPGAIPRDVALCLFRIAQEGLRNVKRHSGADRAEVRLEGFGENLHLSISDRGRGFDPNGPGSGGIGIRSMEERLRLLGGNLEIQSRPMEGTRIDAWLRVKVASKRAS